MPLTRRFILQKGRHHPSTTRAGQALTDCRRTVSGTLSLPSRGTFHHSLTVLSAIGHQEVFSLTRWSWQIHGRFQESTATREHQYERPHVFVYRTLTVYGRLSHTIPLPRGFITFAACVSTPQQRLPTPHTQPLTSIPRTRFRLPPL